MRDGFHYEALSMPLCPPEAKTVALGLGARIPFMRALVGSFPVVWLALLALTDAHAKQDPLHGYFPTMREVPRLEATDDGRYCSREDLTPIYDGGYKRYLDAGVVNASQRFFRLPGGTVEITLNQLNTQAVAQAFMASLCQDSKAAVESRSFKKRPGRVCVVTTQATAYGYLTADKLVAMVSFDQADEKTLRALLYALGKRISKR
jgi:hypothetical protein